jgi:hypothetical protein
MIARLFATVFAAFLLCSCVTTVNSKRVTATSSQQGVRYYLPQPFLLVTPKADGLSVQKLMLPDLRSQYALDIQSYMSSYKSNVELQNGLLTKVMLDLDNTKIATDSVTAAGDIAKAKLDLMGTEAAAEKTRETLVDTQRQKLALQIELKRQDIAFLEAQQPRDDSAIAQARRELDQMHLKLEFLEKTGNPSLFNVANTGSQKTAAYLQQPGAVLYKVVQGPASVQLVPVNKQSFLYTVAKGPSETATEETKQSPYTLGTAPAGTKSGAEVKIPITIHAEGFDLGSGSLSKGNKVIAALEPALDAARKNIVFTMPAGLSRGSYKAEISWFAKDHAKPKDSISFTLVVGE